MVGFGTALSFVVNRTNQEDEQALLGRREIKIPRYNLIIIRLGSSVASPMLTSIERELHCLDTMPHIHRISFQMQGFPNLAFYL